MSIRDHKNKENTSIIIFVTWHPDCWLLFKNKTEICSFTFYPRVYLYINLSFELTTKAEHFSQFREALKNWSSELFFWQFERLILIYSFIFWYCMITRQLIVKTISINYARNSKKKVPMSNFWRPLEIGKSVQL
jgi:hypothetical protein